MSHCGYPHISRNYLGNTNWELHHRTGYDSCGSGTHGGQHSEEIKSSFAATCDDWAVSFKNYWSNYGGVNLNWIGDVGIMVCKPGMHEQGRAVDLTQLRAGNGDFIDMNTSWRPSLACASIQTRRMYVGVAASLRRYFGTVLTAWYNADHENHIHFDDSVSLPPIRTSATTDTTLVQASCNYLNGESLTIDGAWGPLTEAAYGRLLNAFRMDCKTPKSNLTHALLFLELIVKHGLAGIKAGTYFGPC